MKNEIPGWKEFVRLIYSGIVLLVQKDVNDAHILLWWIKNNIPLIAQKNRNMDKYTIEIRVDVKYLECECSPNTPCLFADEIRKLAKEYFNDVINPKSEK